jgi:hypothetical protein
VFVDGAYSHAVRKQSLFGADRARLPEGTAVSADPDEIEAAVAALDAAGAGDAVYARVDLLRADDGRAVVSEVELVEPTLFFHARRDAATRLAEAVERRAS